MTVIQEKWRNPFKSLSFGRKVEYLWMYYKGWLVIGVFVAAGMLLAINMYQGMRQNVMLNVAIVGGSSQNTKELEKEFKAFAGMTGKHDKVHIKDNIPADGGAITSKTALTTLIGANAVDVMLCPEDIYQEYDSQGGFVELKGLQGEIAGTNKVVFKSNAYLCDVAGVPYEEVYAAVLVNAQHKKEAELFVRFLIEKNRKTPRGMLPSEQ